MISLLNISGCAKGITIQGAKYPLCDEEITCEYQYGTSNEVLPGKTAVVSASNGKLLLIKVYTIVGIWNSWFGASIYITNKEWQPAQLFLRNVLVSLQSGSGVSTNEMAGLTQDVQEQMAALAMSARQLRYTMIVIVTMPIVIPNWGKSLSFICLSIWSRACISICAVGSHKRPWRFIPSCR